MASSKARSRKRPASGKSARAAGGNGRNPSRTGGGSSARPARTQPAAGQAQASAVQVTAAGQAAAGQARAASRAKRQPAPVAAEPARPPGPPLWLQIASLALAAAGLAVSAYETYAHFNGSHLAGCPTGGNGTFNCTAVITSPQSMVFGVIPVAILGLVFYVFAVAIMTPWAWRTRRREVGWLRLGSMIVGMGFVMYLIYAELYQIGDICEYCTGVHVITFLLFCITVVSAALWGLGAPRKAS
jgi:uncharacterized membrane protein